MVCLKIPCWCHLHFYLYVSVTCTLPSVGITVDSQLSMCCPLFSVCMNEKADLATHVLDFVSSLYELTYAQFLFCFVPISEVQGLAAGGAEQSVSNRDEHVPSIERRKTYIVGTE